MDLRIKNYFAFVITISCCSVAPACMQSEPLGEILPWGTRTDTGPLASRPLVETCIACLYSNQNITKIFIVILLATGLR